MVHFSSLELLILAEFKLYFFVNSVVSYVISQMKSNTIDCVNQSAMENMLHSSPSCSQLSTVHHLSSLSVPVP